jgi:hypothetical protein
MAHPLAADFELSLFLPFFEELQKSASPTAKRVAHGGGKRHEGLFRRRIGPGVSAAPLFSARTCQAGWTDASDSCPSAPRLSAIGEASTNFYVAIRSLTDIGV